jgi:hypothetical protein
MTRNHRNGNITVILDFISKGFFLISKQGGFAFTQELMIEVRVNFWEFSQGSECVGQDCLHQIPFGTIN